MLGRKVYVSDEWKYDYFMLEKSTTDYDQCFIEITLNHPRNKFFRTCSRDEQKAIYANAYELIKRDFAPLTIVRDLYNFEECKDGTIHFHAQMQMKWDHAISPMGVVCAIVQTWFSTLTPKYRFNPSDIYNTQYRRIRTPSIACQFVEIANLERAHIWETYINKSPV